LHKARFFRLSLTIGSRDAALGITEQLRFDQAIGERRAIDGDERAGPSAGGMGMAGELFLAGTSLAADQDRHLACRAFTGAKKGGAAGLFREADGGTLFLDEIGDMPVTLQAVLLRFLDDWTVRPVGGAKRQVDVLLVSATNADLGESIAKGRFRSDLLFRLNTLEVTLPPLRERSDFAEIARHLIEKIDPSADLTESAIDRLAELNWDGNIRELRNVLSRLSLAERGNLIDGMAVESIVGPSFSERLPGGASGNSGLKHDLHEIQRAHVLAAYVETGNNISKTARRLGVSRNTIYRALRDKQS
jgi:transcriptional regulator with PAS, ATPase and Fis domain